MARDGQAVMPLRHDVGAGLSSPRLQLVKALQQILHINSQNFCDRRSLPMVRSAQGLRSGTAEKADADYARMAAQQQRGVNSNVRKSAHPD